MISNKNETPYEKFLANGPESLTDVELLAIIIRNGTKNKDALDLAHQILSKYDDSNRIVGLQNLSFEELTSYEGIGKIKAMCIGCIIELSKRMHMQSKRNALSFTNPGSIADYYMEQLRHLKQEMVLLLLLDVKGNLIKELTVTIGTINSSLISTRDIFIAALNYKASCVVLIHNHPSGDSNPSKHDMNITAKLKKAGELLDIPLTDHIIIGDRNYFSYKNAGYI